MDYLERVLNFKRDTTIATGKCNQKEYVIVIGHQEYREIMSYTINRGSRDLMPNGNFDGMFGGFPLKRLDIDNAFTIMPINVFNNIVNETKRAMIHGLSHMNTTVELR